MKGYLLDTSVVIEYLRGNKAWVEKLDNLEGEMNSSFVCLAELYEGIARDTKKDTETRVLGFFQSLSDVYGLDGQIAENFGKLRAGLRKTGNIIEDMDLLVAATCKAKGLVLVTANKDHFSRISGLEMV